MRSADVFATGNRVGVFRPQSRNRNLVGCARQADSEASCSLTQPVSVLSLAFCQVQPTGSQGGHTCCVEDGISASLAQEQGPYRPTGPFLCQQPAQVTIF